MNEDELVAALAAIVDGDAAPNGKIVLGIGDDAAAWQPSRSHLSVVTTDALVDGVHFVSDSMEAHAIGHRALASNLSDIAAMGARPVLATIALGVKPGTSEAWILDCYRGLSALAKRARMRIVGGDIVRAPATMLSITVIGEVSRTRLKTRAGGRPGDVIAVTGPLGGSRAGLEVLRRGFDFAAVDAAHRDDAYAVFSRPDPRLAEGRFLAASTHVRAMMDTSDGLSTDLARLARASGCGARVEQVPVRPSASAIAAAAGDDPEAYALDGGEDFELLLTIAPRAFAHLSGRFRARFGIPLIRVGVLVPGKDVSRAGEHGEMPLEARGFDHLREPTSPQPARAATPEERIADL